MHKVYEQAVDRAMNRHSRSGRGWWRREQRQEEVSVSIFALIIGLIGGAALMYLFDPERGARRRALLQIQVEDALSGVSSSIEETAQRVRTDVEQAAESIKETTEQVRGDVEKTVGSAAASAQDKAAQIDKAVDNAADSAKSTASQVGQAMSGTARDAATKVKSAANEAKQQVEAAVTSDQTLTVRVRTAVAGGVRAPGAIDIDVKDGTVTLTGTIPAGEVQQLVEKVEAIPGVTKVDNRLEIHDAAQT
jgi:hypothetical protein